MRIFRSILVAVVVLSGSMFVGWGYSNVVNKQSNSEICADASGKGCSTKITKEFTVGAFSKIEARQGIKIVWNVGAATEKVSANVCEKYAQYLKVETVRGTLKAYFDFPTNEPLDSYNLGTTVITITAPSLSAVELSSAAKLEVNGTWRAEADIDIEISSAGSLSASMIDCKELDLEVSSAGSVDIVTINGSLDAEASSAAKLKIGGIKGSRLKVEASSGASFTADRAECEKISAESSSAAKVSINGIVCGNLSAEASSGSTIQLSGECDTLKLDNSGAVIFHDNLRIKSVSGK